MDKETEDRVIALETKLAYLEDFVNQLQEVSVAQTKQIDILKQENRLMSGKLQDLSDSLDEIPNRKPPHY
ncbi:MAG TPA: SlyX protein [Treponema sp.]|nr:SlyX protein [Treponema sp.]